MKKTSILLGFATFFFLLQNASAQAGQVVTNDDKAWAKQAIEQEKSRGPVYSPNTVAVMYFRNNTGKEELNPLQKGFAFLLMSDLSQVDQIQLVERVKLQALVEELNLGSSGLVTQDSSPRVGKLLGASYLVEGDFLPAPSADLDVKSNILGVKKEQILGQPEAEGKISDIFSVEKKVLFEIIDILKIELTPEQRTRLQKPFTNDLQAFMSFINGMESSDKGNYSKAGSYYQQAIQQDPQMKLARDALAELKSLNLVNAPKKSQDMLRSLESSTSTTKSITRTTITEESGNASIIKKRSSSGNMILRW